MDSNNFINSVKQIVNNEIDKKSQDSVCIIKSINDDGTVNIVIPPDMDTIIYNIKNESSGDPIPGSSALLYKVNNRINNSFIISCSSTKKDSTIPSNGFFSMSDSGMVSRIERGDDYSEIKQTVDQISLTVHDQGEKLNDATSSISIQADQIQQRVTKTEYNEKIGSMDASINEVTTTANGTYQSIKNACGDSLDLESTLNGIRASIQSGSGGNIIFKQSTPPEKRGTKEEGGVIVDVPLVNNDLWYCIGQPQEPYVSGTWYAWNDGAHSWDPVRDSKLVDQQSQFEVSLNQIRGTVSSHTTTIQDLGQEIVTVNDKASEAKQTADGFETRVSSVESIVGPDGQIQEQLSSMSSEISQTSEAIQLKVDKNGVISSINQSSETITIQAEKINLDGNVNMNGGYINSKYNISAQNLIQSQQISANDFCLGNTHFSKTTFESTKEFTLQLYENFSIYDFSPTIKRINQKFITNLLIQEPIYANCTIIGQNSQILYAPVSIYPQNQTIEYIDLDENPGNYFVGNFDIFWGIDFEPSSNMMNIAYRGERQYEAIERGFKLTNIPTQVGYESSLPLYIKCEGNQYTKYVSFNSNGISQYANENQLLSPTKTINWDLLFNTIY